MSEQKFGKYKCSDCGHVYDDIGEGRCPKCKSTEIRLNTTKKDEPKKKEIREKVEQPDMFGSQETILKKPVTKKGAYRMYLCAECGAIITEQQKPDTCPVAGCSSTTIYPLTSDNKKKVIDSGVKPWKYEDGMVKPGEKQEWICDKCHTLFKAEKHIETCPFEGCNGGTSIWTQANIDRHIASGKPAFKVNKETGEVTDILKGKTLGGVGVDPKEIPDEVSEPDPDPVKDDSWKLEKDKAIKDDTPDESTESAIDTTEETVDDEPVEEKSYEQIVKENNEQAGDENITIGADSVTETTTGSGLAISHKGNMNFFTQMEKYLGKGLKSITITVQKNLNELTVVFLPVSAADDPATHNFIPLTFTDTAEKLDSDFLDDIASPMEKVTDFCNNVKAFEDQLKEKEKQTKKAKDEKEKKEKEYKALISKGDKAMEAKKYQDALGHYGKAKSIKDTKEVKEKIDKASKGGQNTMNL